MSNVGRIIRDVYCNGYADNEYDMDGAEIVAEGEDWIVCRKSNGRNVFIDFQQWEWDRDERGYPTEVINLKIDPDKQNLIDIWCKGNFYGQE